MLNHNRPDAPVKVSPIPAKLDPPDGATKPWVVRVHPDFLDPARTPLSDQARYVALVLDGFARADPFCWPGNDALATATGKKPRAIQLILDELEDVGRIRRVYTEEKRRERIGIILLRRAHPDLPAADVPERLVRAEAAVRERKNPHSQSARNRTHRAQDPALTRAQEFAPELSRCRKKDKLNQDELNKDADGGRNSPLERQRPQATAAPSALEDALGNVGLEPSLDAEPIAESTNDDPLLAERDENEIRKEFEPSERVAIARAIKERFKGRQGKRTDKEKSNGLLPGNGPEVPPGVETRTVAAKYAGFDSERDLRRAEQVVDEGVPELVEAMDQGEVKPSTSAERDPIEARVELAPPDDPTSPPDPVAVGLDRAMSELDQVLSLAGEPTFYGSLWAAGRDFVAGLDDDLRGKLAAMNDNARDEVLRLARIGKDRKAYDRLRWAPEPRRHHAPPPGPPPDATTAELLEALTSTRDASVVPRLARRLMVEFGDKDRSWPYIHGLIQQVREDKRPVACLLEPYLKTVNAAADRTGKKPIANPTAYFVRSVKTWERENAPAGAIVN